LESYKIFFEVEYVCVCGLKAKTVHSKRQDSTEMEQRVAQILSEAQRAIHEQAAALQKA